MTNERPDYPLEPPLIGALLRRLWETVRERMLSGLHQAGFSDLVAAHLTVLQYPGPENRRPSDLAAETNMSKQAIDYLLGQMEELGYLAREHDANDPRSRRIRLTERGHAAARTMRDIVREVEREWAKEVGPTRFEQLRELLIEIQPAPRAD